MIKIQRPPTLDKLHPHEEEDTSNLPLSVLQSKLKKDPKSYENEFITHFRHFEANFEVLKLSPSTNSKRFTELLMFVAHTCTYFKDRSKEEDNFFFGLNKPVEDLATTFGNEILDFLHQNYAILHTHTRQQLVYAIMLLRTKRVFSCLQILPVWFELINVSDKFVRRLLTTHIIKEICKEYRISKDIKVQQPLKNFIFQQFTKGENGSTHRAALILIELYRRRIWVDLHTVNFIANFCFSDCPKTATAGCYFLLGNNDVISEELEESDEEENAESLLRPNKYARKTGSKKRKREALKKSIKSKARKRDAKRASLNSLVSFAAMDVLYDPQQFAESLYARLSSTKISFALRLLLIELTSRLIGRHQLILLNFYTFIQQRYLQPHQRYVTTILASVAQATHTLVPPLELQNINKSILHIFVTPSQTPETIAIGVNAIREICTRAPLALDKEMLEDLVGFRDFKNKNVVVAVKSIINLYRNIYPKLLHRKLRGKTAAMSVSFDGGKVPEYGEVKLGETLEGLSALKEDLLEIDDTQTGSSTHTKTSSTDIDEDKDENESVCSMEDIEESDEESVCDFEEGDDESVGSMEDIEKSDEESVCDIEEGDDESVCSKEDIDNDDEDTTSTTHTETTHNKKRRKLDTVSKEELNNNTHTPDTAKKNEEKTDTHNTQNNEDLLHIAQLKFLTDQDFNRIKKRKARELSFLQGNGVEVNDDHTSDEASSNNSSDEESEEDENGDYVDPESLKIRTKQRKSKNISQRKAQKLEEAANRRNLKYKRKLVGAPNTIKDRNKPIPMIRQSRRRRNKINDNIKDKMTSLRKHLTTLKKRKVSLKKRRKH